MSIWLICLILFQANEWVEVTPGGTAPTAREGHAAGFDSTNGRMWVFGGLDGPFDGPLLSAVQHAYSIYWKNVREIFGSTKQLVSRNEAAAAGKMIYTTTTWRCSSLFLVDDWGWNIEMLWRADHQYLPCALCVVLPLIPMRCHGMFTTKVLVPLLLLSFCFELWRAHVSKCQQNCETLWLLETLATCSNASFCFVEIGRVGCFSPLAHVFHIHGPAEQAEKGDSKASSHFFNIRVSMAEKNMLFSWGCISRAAELVEGSLEVKLPTIWTDEKQSREEAERRERLEERRVEEKE